MQVSVCIRVPLWEPSSFHRHAGQENGMEDRRRLQVGQAEEAVDDLIVQSCAVQLEMS